jgi:hypothetical protein
MKTEIHIFSPGTQTSAQGVTREFTSSDLQQVANSYNADLHEAPIRIGHEDNDKVPSWGWVKQVKLKGEDLYAEVEFSPLMEDYVKNGLYRKVSASFYAPESKINPDPGSWSLRHVAMLGAQPPAVKGLKGFAYAEESADEGVLDFAVEMKLSPDQVFDEELGPTVREEQSPLEQLKEKLDEARSEMVQEEKRKEDLGQAEEDLDAEGIEASASDEDFAEVMKKKPSKAKQGAEDVDQEEEGEDDDDVQSKEKKMDPVGEADGDIDNDGDEDSSDEYLKKRRSAIKKSIKADTSDNGEMPEAFKKNMKKKKDESEEDTSDNGECSSSKGKKRNYVEPEEMDADTNDNEEYETDEGEGPVASKVKKSPKDGASALDHSEISVPEGMDAPQWEAGFKDAMDKFYAAAESGADEVVHQEAEDQSADYLAGIEAGFEFAQARLNRIGSDGIGSAKHDDKCCSEDEEAEGQGPVASKIKKQKTGANETDGDQGVYGEATFVPEKKKRGHDNDKSSDVGVKAESEYEEDEEQHGEPFDGQKDDFGRGTTGKAGKGGETDRNKKGKSGPDGLGTQAQADEKGSDGGAQDKTRAAKGAAKPPKQDGGKSADVQKTSKSDPEHLGAKEGSGKAIKSPAVRVMRFSEQQEASFSELSARLAELEAANAKLVAEKAQAEQRAHRMQLEEFAESLYATGRLTPAVCEAEELVDYLEGLEYGTLEFAEGETQATKLMELLASLPAQVSFSEIASHDEDALPEESLDPHSKALRLVKESGIDYAEALKQTLFTAE